ncbi:MAG: hypothetical protein M3015_08110 [Bacteroidota bacterium]|nr:hypothetical protein [Bacteroidota bacterium]
MSTQNLQQRVTNITKELSLEDASNIFYEIILQKKLEESEKDVEAGKIYSTEHAKEKLKRWFS